MALLPQAFRRTWLSRFQVYSSTSPSSARCKLLTTTTQTTKQQLPKSQPFATSSTAMTADSFLSAVKARRTYYQLDSSSTISDERIQELLNQIILNTPSAFNSQTTRALLLLGDEHRKLWNDITKPAVKAVAPAEAWPASDQKLAAFANAYGTVLFFEDEDVVTGLQKAIPAYASMFPEWSQQTNGMHASNLWIALEQEGLGANLQHYSNLIGKHVAETWGIPTGWQLKAQLVFGTPAGQPGEKTFKPLEERVKSFGGNLTLN